MLMLLLVCDGWMVGDEDEDSQAKGERMAKSGYYSIHLHLR